jgi:hypothetical protein
VRAFNPDFLLLNGRAEGGRSFLTRLDLFAQHHRQEPGIAINGLVSGHVLLSCFERLNIDSTDGYSFPLGGGFCTASTLKFSGWRNHPME